MDEDMEFDSATPVFQPEPQPPVVSNGSDGRKQL